ncbi:fe(2+) transport protein 1-like isoform X2 [Durio zibethinus]|uniref:Fe(2+) transport protein 1-like isoform X2 n=1 Tax=Durio zibethinus TaxID=66656 RepID=A0A6P5Y3Y9_DURZI|nr:fe(2+) transport protein 1-like isoform X2 [Durio zibethinus]
MASFLKFHALSTFLAVIIIFLSCTPLALAKCEAESENGCHDKAESMKLKVIAIVVILVASMIGVCLPLFSRLMPALRPDRDYFTVVKAFASGVILATGYMHVLPDSFNDLTSDCLPENPWKKFPFTTFVAMLSAVMTLMVDSFAMSIYKKHCAKASVNFGHGHHHPLEKNETSSQLLRHRVIAQVLELGIIVHSVVIGIGMGASDNKCTIRSLIAALCFHQMFEGMGLGGSILQAEYKLKMKATMAFFFSTTTPLGIVVGIGLSRVYSETSPTSLIVVGLLNACSAGLLNYMALVDLLAAEFMGPKLQTNMKLQAWSYIAVLFGAGFMSLMAKWA